MQGYLDPGFKQQLAKVAPALRTAAEGAEALVKPMDTIISLVQKKAGPFEVVSSLARLLPDMPQMDLPILQVIKKV